MKIVRKISVILLGFCLSLSCFSLIVHAADGRVSFTDPSTAVGEMVEVKCVAKATNGNLGNVEVALGYDKEYLRFDSGDGISDGGEGTLTCQNQGGAKEVSFNITFQALKEGTTNITVSSVNIVSEAGAALSLEQGNSTIQIAAGDPSKITAPETTSGTADMEVELNDQKYQLSDSFLDVDIPNGFSRTEVKYEGSQRQMVKGEKNGVCLAYLLDTDGVGEFFVFDEETATFSRFEQVQISDSMSIILLSDDNIKLPSNYVKTTLTMNGSDFPVWQNTDKEEFYLIYAVNDNGTKEMYQYDSQDNTYQRYEVSNTKEQKEDNSLLGKIKSFIQRHLTLFVVGVGVVLLFGFILLIIVAVKLHNRNVELDELYDEYDIDAEDILPMQQTNAMKSASVKGKKEVRKFDEDNFDEDVYNEDDFENNLLIEDDDDEFDLFDEDEVLDSEDDIDDLDAMLADKPQKKRGHIEDDDTFKVDFIDLD